MLRKDALSLKPCNYKTSETLVRSNFRVFVQHCTQFFRVFFGMSVTFSILFNMGNYETKALFTARNIFSFTKFNKMNFTE